MDNCQKSSLKKFVLDRLRLARRDQSKREKPLCQRQYSSKVIVLMGYVITTRKVYYEVNELFLYIFIQIINQISPTFSYNSYPLSNFLEDIMDIFYQISKLSSQQIGLLQVSKVKLITSSLKF